MVKLPLASGNALRHERDGGRAVAGGADGVKLDSGAGDGLLAAVDPARDLDRRGSGVGR